jgi:aryl-alcohol dehydrogenase-like predicted oxidoreductase
MEVRRLGRSGLHVSEFALGAMTFGMPKWGCDEATAIRLVDHYLDRGGNVLDTADAYSNSEEICGRAIKAKRSKVVLATKCGLPVGAGPHDRGAGRVRIRAACEASLRRLGTDHIDLYQLHVDDVDTPLQETMAALDDLVREGKVLYIGVSNMRAFRVMKALGISDQRHGSRFVSFQGQYNLIVRTLEREHFQLFAEEGLGLIAWSPLAGGMLTGKLQPSAAPADARLVSGDDPTDFLYKNERGFGIVDRVRSLADDVGCTPAQLALAWQRTRPVTSTIIGARTERQLEENLAALDAVIPADVLDHLDRATRPVDEYPGAFVDVFQGWRRGG